MSQNKFVVLWRTAVFFEKENQELENLVDSSLLQEHELVLQCELTETIEDAIRLYNKLASDPVNQEVLILQTIKSFNRTK